VNLFKKKQETSAAKKSSNPEDRSDFDAFSAVVDPGSEQELLSKA